MPKSLTAADLQALLAARHSKDIWVPQCKNGPTHSSDHLLILDGWAMRKSWAHACTLGYEIKVSRSDFEQDQKWPGYLPYCHEFYFVCPGGLIKGADLPDGIGLIWATANGERLVTKVKAAKREPDASKLSLLIDYVLMCRTRIVGDMHEANREGDPKSQEELYREYVANAERNETLAHLVRGHVRARFEAQERELDEMRSKVKLAEEFQGVLAQAGIPWPENPWGSWETRRLLSEKIGEPDHALLNDCDSLIRRLQAFVTENRKPTLAEAKSA